MDLLNLIHDKSPEIKKGNIVSYAALVIAS